MFATPAYAQAAGGAGSAFASFIPLILIFAIMYFLLIRPQQKKVKEHQQMVENLRRGDQVVTQGGVIGKVVKVKDDNEIEVEIAEGVKVRVVKTTVAQVHLQDRAGQVLIPA
jgi:preprotein translocase subunit YajC